MAEHQAARPLDGITVLALEHAVAAPFCTRQLADHGARVIKIERPGVGDFARGYDARANGLSSYFAWLNRSKESLTLDLKAEGAKPVLDALIGKADVVVQNLAPGAAARLGLGWEALSTRDPRKILCDISGYGGDGPYRDRKAYDLFIQAEAGLLSITGTPDAMARTGFSAADVSAGMYGFSSVLAALLLRERTGRGQHIDLALFETLTEWLGNPMYFAHGGPPQPRSGAFHPSIVPYGPYECGDGRTVMIGLQNEREWADFCREILGDASLATDPRFDSNARRTERREEVAALIRAALSGLTAEQAAAKLDAANLATAEVNTPADLWSHPQLEARGRWREVGTENGPLKALAPPGAADPRMDPIPALGEHTEAILAELGFGGNIDRLRAAGAI